MCYYNGIFLLGLTRFFNQKKRTFYKTLLRLNAALILVPLTPK